LIIFDKPIEEGQINGNLFTLKAERSDAVKGRLRIHSKETGEEVAIDLPRGQTLRNGSVFGPSEEGRFYKIEISPERVVRVTVTTDRGDLNSRIKLGYHIGNHHLEALIDGENTYLPVTIGEEKVKEILRRSDLPLKIDTEERVLAWDSQNYFPGEHPAQ
jgi:urease accessory protein UreE